MKSLILSCLCFTLNAIDIEGNYNMNVLFGNNIVLATHDNSLNENLVNSDKNSESQIEKPVNLDVSQCVTENALNTGGTLYLKHKDSNNWGRILDLGDLLWKHNNTIINKPHMVLPSPDNKLFAVSTTAGNKTFIIDSQTLKVVHLIEVLTPNSKIHTAFWHRIENELFIILVDMTGIINGVGGGGLHAYKMDSGKIKFVTSISVAYIFNLDPTTTKPIDAGTNIDGDNNLVVTDAKQGGIFIIKMTKTGFIPIKQFPSSVLKNCKNGGGLWVSPNPKVKDSVFAIFGKQTQNSSCLIDIDVKNIKLNHILNLPVNAIDAHGIGYCVDSAHSLNILISNRIGGTLNIIDYSTKSVKKTIKLEDILTPAKYTGPCTKNNTHDNRRLSESSSSNYFMPDVMSIYHDRVYQVSRGRNAISAISTSNKLKTALPGLYQYSINKNTCDVYSDISDVSLPTYDALSMLKSSDPHGGNIVNGNYILIDQSPSGAIMKCDGKNTYVSKEKLRENNINIYEEQVCENLTFDNNGDPDM